LVDTIRTTGIEHQSPPLIPIRNEDDDEESMYAHSWELRETDRMSAEDIDSLIGEPPVGGNQNQPKTDISTGSESINTNRSQETDIKTLVEVDKEILVHRPFLIQNAFHQCRYVL
jgi:hypothetical protein